MFDIKSYLHAQCLAYIEQRIETAKKAVEHAQSSANDETKSSAGDKYETGRAMMQLEIEKNSVQLVEAIKLKKALLQIDPAKETKVIQPGSLVSTNHGDFYVAVSTGQLTLSQKIYFAISPASPIGVKMMGLKEGDQFQLNTKIYIVASVQ